MTLRHPERLGPEGGYDDESSSASSASSPEALQVGVQDPTTANPVGVDPATPTIDVPPVVANKEASDDIPAPVFPFATDFSLQTLTAFLRTQIEELRGETKTRKGKEQRQSFGDWKRGNPGSGVKNRRALQVTTNSVNNTKTADLGAALSSSPTVARRSQRLANKLVLPTAGAPTPFTTDARVSGEDDVVQSTPSDTAENTTDPVAGEVTTETSTSTPISPSESDDTNSIPRTATFEEHARMRRESVRSMVAASSDAQFEALEAVHQRDQGSSPNGRENSQLGSASKLPPVFQPPHIEESDSIETAALKEQADTYDSHSVIQSFDFAAVVPELIPPKSVKDFVTEARQRTSKEKKEKDKARPRPVLSAGASVLDWNRIMGPQRDSTPTGDNPGIIQKHYPRVWKSSKTLKLYEGNVAGSKLRRSSGAPGEPTTQSTGLHKFDTDLWTEITAYLSTQDVRNLRSAGQFLARLLAPIQYRSVVTKFGRSFFDSSGTDWDSRSAWPSANSMFSKYGSNMNQFGISFEYDLHGLTYAKEKVIEKEQDAWFGKFTWPTEQYPRFPQLQAIEDLVDNNRPLLKDALKHVTRASELGLCVDSGHGWLEGPDMSDLALFDRRMGDGSKVFGKTFTAENVLTSYARNEYFRWAQQNTINEATKHLATKSPIPAYVPKEVNFLDNRKIRDMESFRVQEEQYDFESDCHVGHSMLGPDAADDGAIDAMVGVVGAALVRGRRAASRSTTRRLPQWPLIFDGYDISAEQGGHCIFIQNKTSNPRASPLRPGILTEAQAQWLIETVWAQRAFLSAYTNAIITHKNNFKSIHTLRISKLSSGLLSQLEQGEFWKTLSGLKHLQIFISPDWRHEHMIGDRNHSANMSISPAKAAQRFTDFLRRYVVKIESLHSLSIGYVGGGEHAVGIFARNQHVLPAPIVDDPADWLFDEQSRAHSSPFLLKFDHVRELTFENCWFSPWMLETFMKRSRDTSLHSLTLNSVCMLTYHDATVEEPLTTPGSQLRCLHPQDEWVREVVPRGAAWTRVLDAVTPGVTLSEHKRNSPFKDPEEQDTDIPRPSFRGHVERIVLDSCGYVKISVPKTGNAAGQLVFNQNSAVTHLFPPMDTGLRVRKERFNKVFGGSSANDGGGARYVGGQRIIRRHNLRAGATPSEDDLRHVMMGTTSPTGDPYPWLGQLTQCVHPVEKRILEEAWQMKFGWGDNLDRWGAVEDGQFEGGTGRFSGVIVKEAAGEGN